MVGFAFAALAARPKAASFPLLCPPGSFAGAFGAFWSSWPETGPTTRHTAARAIDKCLLCIANPKFSTCAKDARAPGDKRAGLRMNCGISRLEAVGSGGRAGRPRAQ